MWLSLLAVILILAITFFQSTQGFFSAFIMTVLSLLAAATAFGFAENLYDLILWERMPEYGHSVALMSIFIVSLLVMRLAADQLIRSEMLFPQWVARIGGTVFGFLTAMIVVGTLLIGVQLLPFDTAIMGFDRFDQTGGMKKVWLNPDGFVVGLVGHVSDSALSGRESFKEVHPHYLAEIGLNRIAYMRSARHSADKGTPISIQSAYKVQTMYASGLGGDGDGGEGRRPDKKGESPPVDSEWWGVGLQFSRGALERGKILRFTPAQIHLVGRARPGGPTSRHYPIGIADPKTPEGTDPMQARHIRLRFNQAMEINPEESGYEVRYVFRVPPTFEPWFIDYKMSVRIHFPKSQLEKEEAEPVTDAEPAEKPAKSKTGKKPAGKAQSGGPKVEVKGGRTAGQRAVEENTGFSNALPLAVDRNELRQKRAKLRDGQLAQVDDAIVPLPEVAPTGDFAVSEFWVPKDKRLLQLGQQVSHAGSTAGQAMQFARQSVRQFQVIDSTGKAYFPIGEWVISDYQGTRSIEIQYHPDMADQPGGERAVKRRKFIDRRKMKEDDPGALMFLVPPGTELVNFSSGGNQRLGEVKLNNLVAPK